MIKKLLSYEGLFPIGLDIIRIIAGVIIFTFGWEIMNPENIAGYTEWLTDLGVPFPRTMVIIGKLSELIFGFFLAVGLFTRLSTIPLMGTMLFINFVMSEGHIRSGTMYLMLLFAVFFFVGSGKFSLDYWLSKRRADRAALKSDR